MARDPDDDDDPRLKERRGLKRVSQLLEAHATCFDCGWENIEANAKGTAAQHARKYRHDVNVVETRSTEYYGGGGY